MPELEPISPKASFDLHTYFQNPSDSLATFPWLCCASIVWHVDMGTSGLIGRYLAGWKVASSWLQWKSGPWQVETELIESGSPILEDGVSIISVTCGLGNHCI